MKKEEMLTKILANLFFLFFTSPVLSPAFYSGNTASGNINAGTTVYLFGVIMMLDPQFWIFLSRKIRYRMTMKIGIGVFMFALWNCLLLEFSILVRILIIFTTVCYLYYAYINDVFYLFRWINVNIFIAFFQYLAASYIPTLYDLITPGNIAAMIWGSHAPITFNNLEGAFEDAAFENILGLSSIRVAGLSREGGFFASLISMSLIVSWRYYRNKKELLILIVGLLLSLSKVTFLLIPIVIIYAIQKQLNKIPYVLGLIFILWIFFNLGEWVCENLYLSETFMHRFAGYYAVNYMDFDSLLIGVEKGTVLNPQMYNDAINMEFFPYRFNTFSGYPDMINHIGYIGLGLYFLMMYFMKMRFGHMVFLLLGTITVNLVTVTSFVILCYFIIFIRKKCNDEMKNGGD